MRSPALALALVLGAGCSCGPGPQPSGSRDSGQGDSSGRFDAGPDAAVGDAGGGDSGADAGTIDAGTADAGGDGGPPGCADDAQEPNDTRAGARPLPLGRSALMLCPQNEDWFSLPLLAGDSADLRLTFPKTYDLDLYVFGDDYGLVAYSANDNFKTAGEHVVIPERLRDETLHVRILGYRGWSGAYTMDAAVTHGGSASCAGDDAYEDDDTPATAKPIVPGAPVANLVACGPDEDWYSFGVSAGQRITATATAAGPVLLDLYEPAGTGVARVAGASSGSPLVAATWAQAGGTWLVRVMRPDGAVGTSSYSLQVDLAAGPAPVAVSVAGKVSYDKQTIDPVNEKLGPVAANTPVPGVTVELVRDADARVLARTATDAAGAYSFALANAGDPTLHVRVLASRRDATVQADVVSDASGTTVLYAFAAAPFTGNPAGPVDFHFTVDTVGAAAMNVLHALGKSFAAARLYLGPDNPPLSVNWARGVLPSCGTCYGSLQIELEGDLAGKDEWDDTVIEHESGHFMSDVFSSDDNPGGCHDGNPDDPALAWSEGWATYWAQTADGQPIYYDASYTGGGVFTSMLVEDVEGSDCQSVGKQGCGYYKDSSTQGTCTGTHTYTLSTDERDKVSEVLVSAVLWDLADAHDDAGDTLSAGAAAVTDPFKVYLGSRAANASQVAGGRTFKGIDLVDFLDGWFCRKQGHLAEVQAMLTYRQVPYDYAGPPSCP